MAVDEPVTTRIATAIGRHRSGRLSIRVKSPIYRIVLAQLVATVLLAAVCLVVSLEAAYSFLLGGLTCVLPSLFMVWRVNRPESEPGLALKHMVRGELGKLSLTFLMFILTFYWVEPLSVGFFFSGLVLGMFCNILMPLLEIRFKLSSEPKQDLQNASQD